MGQLCFPWIIFIEISLLVTILGLAYSIGQEAIESTVGPHLLHVITVSLLTMSFVRNIEETNSYAKVYAWTNLLMDNFAMFLMLFRYSQSTTLELRNDESEVALFAVYISCIVGLIIVDIHNVSFTFPIVSTTLPFVEKQFSKDSEDEGMEDMVPMKVMSSTEDNGVALRAVTAVRARALPFIVPMNLLYPPKHVSSTDFHCRQHPSLNKNNY